MTKKYLFGWDTAFSRWFGGAKTEINDVHLDHILTGSTCSPISLQDFRSFLQLKEHTAENLDFYYWYIGYCERFKQLSDEEKEMSPPPTEKPHPKNTKQLPAMEEKQNKCNMFGEPDGNNPENLSSFVTAPGAEKQPFRDEVNTVLRTFFHPDSFKELNVIGYQNRYTVYWGTRTTNPEVFEDAHQHIRQLMEKSSLKNFVHHAVQNIRYSWIMLHYIGTFVNFMHVVSVFYYTYTHHMCRWYRIPIFPFTFLFLMSLLSGRSGFCTIRGSMKFRQTPLYELDLRKSDGMKKADIESISDLTSIIDSNVIRKQRTMIFHIWTSSLLLAICTTIPALVITNENDPLPLPLPQA
ncbi:hypothetical protein CLU79DRAFT_381083 [Phycomyces nitens]|nr:hypothetical protein CLU79DRAFT_381083 [Phycomyces nitens]